MTSPGDPTPGSNTPAAAGKRLSGARFVLISFAVTIAVAAIVILAGVLVIADRGDPEEACATEPDVCSTVHDFVAASNERDARGLQEVLTEDGMQALLGVASREELEQRLQLLSPADKIDSVEINRVGLNGDEAQVVARLFRGDDEFPALYRLIRSDGDWLIDGS